MWKKRYVSNTDAIAAFLRGEIVYNKNLTNYPYFRLRNWQYHEQITFLDGKGKCRPHHDKETMVAVFAKFEQFQKGWAVITELPTIAQENRLNELRERISVLETVKAEYRDAGEYPGDIANTDDTLTTLILNYRGERNEILDDINKEKEKEYPDEHD